MTEAVEYRVSPARIQRMGPYILVAIGGEERLALLDTGASFSGIDIAIARELRFAEEAEPHHVVGATGAGIYPQFRARLYIPVLDIDIPSPVRGLPLRENQQPWSAIIGRDVICQYEFTVNGQTGLIRFANP